jgi:hypothetical protein
MRRSVGEWLQASIRGYQPHARASDPQTSHDAVPHNITEQMLRVLRGYADGVARTDHDAYTRVGMFYGDRQRCTDLRDDGLIERVPDPVQPPDGEKTVYLRGKTPSGKAGYLCVITPAGRQYLKDNT